ncbi:hypothetical protein [Pseudalgibacter alginicilyticus]|nr:hypothetical protein [Pseudalgibacter alginicilyticus]
MSNVIPIEVVTQLLGDYKTATIQISAMVVERKVIEYINTLKLKKIHSNN